MTYLDEAAVELVAGYPKFEDGRVDYSRAKVSYCLNCVAVAGDEVLLTVRSERVNIYPGAVSGVSGYVDRPDLAVEEQARIELDEEVGAPEAKITAGEMMVQVDERLGREWRIFPVLAEFDEKFVPKLNWENQAAEWYKIEEAREMELMPGFAEILEEALKLRREVKNER